MLRSLQLLLPALIPSWRFFDVITPSPRIEFAWLKSQHEIADHWHEFRPRPVRLSFVTMLRRLFWNPEWNETLFIVSCAEQVIENPACRSQDEIKARIISDLRKNMAGKALGPYLQFRLILISRQEDELHREILFTSSPYPHGEGTAL